LGSKARQTYEAGRHDEAISWADRALARDPDDHSALLARAKARLARLEYEQARQDLERLVALSPNEIEAYSLLMQAETKLGLTERVAATQKKRVAAQGRLQAISQLSDQLEEHPDDPDLRYRYGQLALEGRSHLLALRCFEAALALDPDHKPARAGLAEVREKWLHVPAPVPPQPR
jgi:tetratricopeptide (TPR) repeat protein